MTREKYTEELAQLISEALWKNEDLRYEAAIEGRTGLKEMTDDELAEFGLDCYDLEWNRDA